MHAVIRDAIRRAGAWAVAFFVLVFAPRAAHAETVRYGEDLAEMQTMTAANPAAVQKLEEGERLAVDGRLEEALALFKQVRDSFPDASLPHRRVCEAMTSLGKGPEGVGECTTAAQASRTNVNLRAVIRALLGGPAAPTVPHLTQALVLLNAERTRAANHWEMSSALCDIADRIGDGDMLQQCTGELLRLAPTASETGRALARMQSGWPPLRFYTGWLAIFAAFIATGVHAARRAGARLRGAATVGAALVLGLLVACPGVAYADEDPNNPKGLLSKWQISDTDPESSVPNEADRARDPLSFGYWLQDLIAKGRSAEHHGDHEAAIRYYRAMIKAVPDETVGYLKLCAEYEATGDRDKAIATCGGALLLPGVKVEDYAHYVHLVLTQPRPLTGKEKDTLREVIDNLKADSNAHPIVDELECEVGSRTADRRELEECVPPLLAAHPTDGKTVYYQWALALSRNDFTEASRLLDRAKEAGLPPEGISSMQVGIARARRNRAIYRLLLGLCLALLATGLAIAARRLARRSPAAQPVA